jgi:hypothetical protein
VEVDPMKYLFKGGALDGQEFEESGLGMDLIKVPVKDGKHYSYPNDVILDYQVYVRTGETYNFNPELSYK